MCLCSTTLSLGVNTPSNSVMHGQGFKNVSCYIYSTQKVRSTTAAHIASSDGLSSSNSCYCQLLTAKAGKILLGALPAAKIEVLPFFILPIRIMLNNKHSVRKAVNYLCANFEKFL